MRFFLLELRARLVGAVIAISLYGKVGRAIPIRRWRLDAKRSAASAIQRVELLRGMSGGERRKCDFGLREPSLARLCQTLIPLAELSSAIGGERPAERCIDGYRICLSLDEHPLELAANHFGKGALGARADDPRHPVLLGQAFEPVSGIDRVAQGMTPAQH